MCRRKKRRKKQQAEREDGYRENTFRREGARQAATVAAAAELTEHRISDAVKLENASQQSSPGQLSWRKSA